MHACVYSGSIKLSTVAGVLSGPGVKSAVLPYMCPSHVRIHVVTCTCSNWRLDNTHRRGRGAQALFSGAATVHVQ